MFAVLFNLDAARLGNKAVVFGPFKAMHTVAIGEFRLLPIEADKDATHIYANEGGMFEYAGEEYYDLEIVSDLESWGEYDLTQVGMPE